MSFELGYNGPAFSQELIAAANAEFSQASQGNPQVYREAAAAFARGMGYRQCALHTMPQLQGLDTYNLFLGVTGMLGDIENAAANRVPLSPEEMANCQRAAENAVLRAGGAVLTRLWNALHASEERTACERIVGEARQYLTLLGLMDWAGDQHFLSVQAGLNEQIVRFERTFPETETA